MKDRPILFSAPMVRAILAGTKTQTRRVVKPQPEAWNCDDGHTHYAFRLKNGSYHDVEADGLGRVRAECPYGQPGYRLWVRETFQRFSDDGEILYRADRESFDAMNELKKDECLEARWRPSIHMPRLASRIDLEIVYVRVERLNDISPEDCLAEGIASRSGGRCALTGEYRQLWESINGQGSWTANPWVWVVEFKRVKP